MRGFFLGGASSRRSLWPESFARGTDVVTHGAGGGAGTGGLAGADAETDRDAETDWLPIGAALCSALQRRERNLTTLQGLRRSS